MAAVNVVQLNAPTFSPVTQAVLEYAGVQMSICRTTQYDCKPELDYAGVDYVGVNEVTLGVIAVVNPAATASLSGKNPPGLAGDRAGVTMANLQQVLMQKQQTLIYRIGPDVLIRAPQDPVLLSDAKNGPEPLALRIIRVSGAKTALIYFLIRCWVGGNTVDPKQNNIVLSNRWDVQASVDDDWKTTIVTTGRMRLRTDILANTFSPATPDIFRQSVLPLPIPDGFKRRVPLIQVTPGGEELAWQCVDEQQILNMPTASNFGVTRVEGQYTTGADVAYQDFKDLVKESIKDAGALAGGNMLGVLWNIFQTFFPAIRNTFQFRVVGPPQGNQASLFGIALLLILDRFLPQMGGFQLGNPLAGGLVSLYATFHLSKMEVELRGAILGTLAQGLAAFNAANIGQGVLSGDMPLVGWFYTQPTANPNPPNANTSRGVYIGALLEQALLGAYTLPANNAQAERGAAAADIGKNFQ